MNAFRIFLLSVIVTLSFAAILGIAAVFATHLNYRFILTDLTVSLFSLTCLGASVARPKNLWRLAAIGTYLFSAIGLIVSMLLIWDTFSYPHSEPWARLLGISITWSIALPTLLLLSLTRFTNGLAYLRLVTLAVIALLAAQITVGIIVEPRDDLAWRFIAANAILASLGILSLPILYRLYGAQNPTDPVSARPELQIICPRCFQSQTIQAGDSVCSQCKLKFHLEIEEPRCRQCGYLLYQLTEPRCPECGTSTVS